MEKYWIDYEMYKEVISNSDRFLQGLKLLEYIKENYEFSIINDEVISLAFVEKIIQFEFIELIKRLKAKLIAMY